MPNSFDSFDPYIYDNPVNAGFFKGYISNFRVTTGQALYTGNFTPPTDTLTATSVGSIGSNVASTISPGQVIVLAFTEDTLTKNLSLDPTIALTGYGNISVQNIKTGLSYEQPIVDRFETSTFPMQYMDLFAVGDVVKIYDTNSDFSAIANVIAVDKNTITFDSIPGFPTAYSSGLRVQNLSPYVYPQAQVTNTNWRTASTPRELLQVSKFKENKNTVKLFIDRNFAEQRPEPLFVHANLTPFTESFLPGDLRIPVVGQSTDRKGNVVVFYQDDTDILSTYQLNTPSTTFYFARQEAILFPIGSNIAISDGVTGTKVFGTVSDCSLFSVTANIPVQTVGNLYVERDHALVYPSSLVRPVGRPKNSRELLWYATYFPAYTQDRSSIPLLLENAGGFNANLTGNISNFIDFANIRITSLGATSVPRENYFLSVAAPGLKGKNYLRDTRYVTGHLPPVVPYTELSNELAPTVPTTKIGSVTYTLPGTYYWTAPMGVSSVSVAAIGGGGGGSNYGEGGGGGGLGWGAVPVTPGQSYTIRVGAGGAGGKLSSNISLGDDGGDSWFASNTTVVGFGGRGGGRNLGIVGTAQAAGQRTFSTPGSYSWTVPAGVTSVSVVAVGGGGGGASGNGGGGGGLGWKNAIPVTPGQSIPVVVGAGGSNNTNGGVSYFGSASLVAGFGGVAGGAGGIFVGDGGGNGGAGGTPSGLFYEGGAGGAGGYTGNGGRGGYNATTGLAGQDGTGGGGGGGGAFARDYGIYIGQRPSGGGGVGLLGRGASGAGAVGADFETVGGRGGSGGGNGTWGTEGAPNLAEANRRPANGGSYGGGGTAAGANGVGGGGAVRIIWGEGRSFPLNAPDVIVTESFSISLSNPGGEFIGLGGGRGGPGGTHTGLGFQSGAGGGGAGGYSGTGGRGGDAHSLASIPMNPSTVGTGGGGGGGTGAYGSPFFYNYSGAGGGGGGGVNLFGFGNSGVTGNLVTSITSVTSPFYENMQYVTGGTVNIATSDEYYEGNDANLYLSNWSPTTTVNMTQMGGLGNTTAHGHSPLTWFNFFSNTIPAHTQVRYSFYWHFVDSVDGETYLFDVNGVRYLQFTKVWNVAGASSTTINLCSANSANGGNFSWRTYNGYSYAPWGSNRGDGFNGYFYVDTGWISHTAANVIMSHYNAADGAITDEAVYISHVRFQYRTTEATYSIANMYRAAANDGWDAQIYSLQPFLAPCTIEFNKLAESGDNGRSYTMIGWNNDPTTNASYDTINYAAYPYRTDIYSVHNNGTQVSFTGAWNPANKFYIVYDTDGFIRHYNGSTLLYSVNYGTSQTVYFDSSFNSGNQVFGGLANVRVSKYSWNGTGYTVSTRIAEGGGGGSGGQRGGNAFVYISDGVPQNGASGGLYGGGGGGGSTAGTTAGYEVKGGDGGGGAVRIVYGPGVSYPTAANANVSTGNSYIRSDTYISSGNLATSLDLLYHARLVPGYRGILSLVTPLGELRGRGIQPFADDNQINRASFLGGFARTDNFPIPNRKPIDFYWGYFALDKTPSFLEKLRDKNYAEVINVDISDGLLEVARQQLREIIDQLRSTANLRNDERLIGTEQRFILGNLERRTLFNNINQGFVDIQLALVRGRIEVFKERRGFKDVAEPRKEPITFWT